MFKPAKKYSKVQEAFKRSYAADKKRNVFTKVRMDFEADAVLLKYFSDKSNEIEGWFNIISPERKTITKLKNELVKLRAKNWEKIR